MSDDGYKAVHRLDTCGLKCPEPVMLLHGAVRDALPGDKIIVTATDPSTERDFYKFCNFLGHDLANFEESEGLYTYEIIKGKNA